MDSKAFDFVTQIKTILIKLILLQRSVRPSFIYNSIYTISIQPIDNRYCLSLTILYEIIITKPINTIVLHHNNDYLQQYRSKLYINVQLTGDFLINMILAKNH